MKPATILLAEDEALLLLDYEAALADAGFVVVAVARGGKAIEVLRSADSRSSRSGNRYSVLRTSKRMERRTCCP